MKFFTCSVEKYGGLFNGLSPSVSKDDGDIRQESGACECEPSVRAGKKNGENKAGSANHHGDEVTALTGRLIHRQTLLRVGDRVDHGRGCSQTLLLAAFSHSESLAAWDFLCTRG